MMVPNFLEGVISLLNDSKKTLQSILSESYLIYFEFLGIVVSWFLVSLFFLKDFWRIIAIILGVFHASYRAFKHVKLNK
jgi:positive regulator of sigma E activity